MKTKYRLKRKTFGFLGQTAGTTMQAAGNVADSGVGKAAGFMAGAAAAPAAGAAIGGLIGGGLGKAAGFITGLGPVGSILGGLAGAKIVSSIGKGLKQAGKDARSNS